MRDSLQWLLEGKDYRVKCFESSESFLSRLDPREVACLIADIRMDGMGGLELQDRLLERKSPPPGGTYAATITSGIDGNFDVYAIWVDLDHDLTFEPTELLAQAATSGTGVQVTSVNVTIPADAAVGYTTMRVMSEGYSIAAGPCGSYLFGETEDYTVVIDDDAPCIPVYLYGTTQEDFIEDVIVGTINNSASGPGSTPYSALTHAGLNHITSLTPNANTSLIITTGPHYSTEDQPNYYSVWVDLDQNGSFAFTERMVLTSSYYPGEVLLCNLVIPTGTPNGYTRMRVMCTFDTIPPDACGTYGYGETEKRITAMAQLVVWLPYDGIL